MNIDDLYVLIPSIDERELDAIHRVWRSFYEQSLECNVVFPARYDDLNGMSFDLLCKTNNNAQIIYRRSYTNGSYAVWHITKLARWIVQHQVWNLPLKTTDTLYSLVLIASILHDGNFDKIKFDFEGGTTQEGVAIVYNMLKDILDERQ